MPDDLEQLRDEIREATREGREVLKDFKQCLHEARELTNQRMTDEAIGKRIESALKQGLSDVGEISKKLIARLDAKMDGRYEKAERELEAVVKRLDGATQYVSHDQFNEFAEHELPGLVTSVLDRYLTVALTNVTKGTPLEGRVRSGKQPLNREEKRKRNKRKGQRS